MGRLIRRISGVALALVAMTVLLPISPAAASAEVDCGSRCLLLALDAICWEKQDCPIPIVIDGKVPTAGITVLFSTLDGSANAPADYVAVREGVVSLKPGDTGARLTLYIEGDKVTEPAEFFSVQFYDPDRRITSDLVKITIVDGPGKAG